MSSYRTSPITTCGALVMDKPNHLNAGPPLVLDCQRTKKK